MVTLLETTQDTKPVQDDGKIVQISDFQTDRSIVGSPFRPTPYMERLSEPEYRVGGREDTQVLGTERARPESIYDVIGEPQEQPSILKIRGLLDDCIRHIETADSEFSNEVARESEMDMLYRRVLRLTTLPIRNLNFDSALMALVVALESHLTETYSRDEIGILTKVFKTLKNNVQMSETVLDDIIDDLEESGFDLSGPFSNLDLHEFA